MRRKGQIGKRPQPFMDNEWLDAKTKGILMEDCDLEIAFLLVVGQNGKTSYSLTNTPAGKVLLPRTVLFLQNVARWLEVSYPATSGEKEEAKRILGRLADDQS